MNRSGPRAPGRGSGRGGVWVWEWQEPQAKAGGWSARASPRRDQEASGHRAGPWAGLLAGHMSPCALAPGPQGVQGPWGTWPWLTWLEAPLCGRSCVNHPSGEGTNAGSRHSVKLYFLPQRGKSVTRRALFPGSCFPGGLSCSGACAFPGLLAELFPFETPGRLEVGSVGPRSSHRCRATPARPQDGARPGAGPGCVGHGVVKEQWCRLHVGSAVRGEWPVTEGPPRAPWAASVRVVDSRHPLPASWGTPVRSLGTWGAGVGLPPALSPRLAPAQVGGWAGAEAGGRGGFGGLGWVEASRRGWAAGRGPGGPCGQGRERAPPLGPEHLSQLRKLCGGARASRPRWTKKPRVRLFWAE